MRIKNLQMMAAAALLAAPLLAAPETLKVPLSDPGKPATVKAGLLSGSMHVVAGQPGEVVIVAKAEEDGHGWGDHHEDCESCPVIAGKAKEWKSGDRAGMKRIPNTSFDLQAEEEKNRVEIGTSWFGGGLDLEIHVPPASSLELSLTNGEAIVVEGVTGELVLHNTNGDIRVRDARGPVNANTINGDVEVSFAGGMASSPMAFSTLNGDIELTMPSAAKIDVRLRSDHGDIFSDFDVALSSKPARVEEGREKGKYRVSVAKELTGRIGGGGPEIFLKTFNGDIVLHAGGR